MGSSAPPSVRPFLARLSQLGNVPRNKKKFLNFAKNSLNIRKDSVLEEMWTFLEAMRVERSDSKIDDSTQPASTAIINSQAAGSIPDDKRVSEGEKSSKKRKRLDDSNQSTEIVIATQPEDQDAIVEEKDQKDRKDKKDKKKKKDKKDKKDKIAEADETLGDGKVKSKVAKKSKEND